MKFEEIKKKFKGEWVMIECTQLDENLVPLEAEAESLDCEQIASLCSQ